MKHRRDYRDYDITIQLSLTPLPKSKYTTQNYNNRKKTTSYTTKTLYLRHEIPETVTNLFWLYVYNV